MKFLVVDDSATMRRIIINCLQRCGYTDYVEADSGTAAFKALDASISVVITDLIMPHMNGIELAKQIRGSHSQFSVPILLVVPRSEFEKASKESLINGFITKPFTPNVLKEKISQITEHLGVT